MPHLPHQRPVIRSFFCRHNSNTAERRISAVCARLSLLAATLLTTNSTGQGLSDYEWTNANPTGSGGGFHDLKRDVRDDQILMAATESGVLRSLNNGASWQRVNSGLAYTRIAALAQDARPGNESTWYALTRHFTPAAPGKGVYRTDNDGVTWIRTSTLSDNTATAIVGDILVQGEGILMTPQSGTGGNVFVSLLSGIYRSKDAGETWERSLGIRDPYFYPGLIETSFGLLASFTTVIDFDQPGFALSANPPPYGFYLSRDSGDTWVHLESDQQFSGIGRLSMAVDPRNPAFVYAFGEYSPKNRPPSAQRFVLFRINLASQGIERIDMSDLDPRHFASSSRKNGILVHQNRLYLGGARLVYGENGTLHELERTLTGGVSSILRQPPLSGQTVLAAGRSGMAFVSTVDDTLIQPLGPASGFAAESASQPPGAHDNRVVAGQLLFSTGTRRSGGAARVAGDHNAVTRLATWLDQRHMLGSGRSDDASVSSVTLDYIDTHDRSRTRLPLPTSGVQVIADPDSRTALAFGNQGLYRHPSIDDLVAYAQTEQSPIAGIDPSAGWIAAGLETGVYQPINSAVRVGPDHYLVLAGRRFGSGISAIRINSGTVSIAAAPEFGDFDGVRSIAADPDDPGRLAAIVGDYDGEYLLLDLNRVDNPQLGRSVDGGLTWTVGPVVFNVTDFGGIAPRLKTALPYREGVLLGTSNGLFWVTDGVATPLALDVIGRSDIQTLSIRAADGRIVVGTLGGGVYVGHGQPPGVRAVAPGLYFDPQRPGHGLAIRTFVDGSTGSFLFSYDEEGESEWFVSTGRSHDGIILADHSGPQRYAMDDSGQVHAEQTTFADFLWDQTTIGKALECAADNAARVETIIDWTQSSWCVDHLISGDQGASGVWFAGEHDSGWGLTIDVRRSVAAVVAFLFDRAGQPVWLLGQSDAWEDGATVTMNRYRGYCRECSPIPLAETGVGEMTLVFDGENLILSMDVTAGAANPRRWQRSDLVLTRLGE